MVNHPALTANWKRDRADDADGGGQGARRVECRETQSVDAQLHDDELPVDRQAGRLDLQNKLKDRRDKLGILQAQQP